MHRKLCIFVCLILIGGCASILKIVTDPDVIKESEELVEEVIKAEMEN